MPVRSPRVTAGDSGSKADWRSRGPDHSSRRSPRQVLVELGRSSNSEWGLAPAGPTAFAPFIESRTTSPVGTGTAEVNHIDGRPEQDRPLPRDHRRRWEFRSCWRGRRWGRRLGDGPWGPSTRRGCSAAFIRISQRSNADGAQVRGNRVPTYAAAGRYRGSRPHRFRRSQQMVWGREMRQREPADGLPGV